MQTLHMMESILHTSAQHSVHIPYAAMLGYIDKSPWQQCLPLPNICLADIPRVHDY